jgi:hypothetical protein
LVVVAIVLFTGTIARCHDWGMAEEARGAAATWTWTRTFHACCLVMVCSAAAVAYETMRVRSTWPPAGWPYSRDIPFITSIIQNPKHVWLVVMSASAIWSVAYAVSLKAMLVKGKPNTFPRAIIGWQIVLLFVIFLSRMPFNPDQYLYVGYGQLIASGYNPYTPPAKSAVTVPQLQAISSVWDIDEGAGRSKVLVRDRYGPFWTIANALVLAPFAHQSAEAQAYVLRLAAALAALACTVVLWLALRGTAYAGVALAAFALSPAIVMQTALGAHNDIYALLMLLVAALFAFRERYAISAVAMAASVAVKLSFAPLIPAFIALALVRRGLINAFTATTLIALTLIVFAFPFGLHAALIQPIEDVHRYNSPYITGFVGGVIHRMAHVRADGAYLGTIYTFLLVSCGLALAFCTVKSRRVPWLEATLLVLIFFGARLEPWYAIILVPLLLIPSRWSIPLFAGITLASQIFQGNGIIASYDQPLPVAPFLCISIFAAFAMRIYLYGPSALFRRVSTVPEGSSA